LAVPGEMHRRRWRQGNHYAIGFDIFAAINVAETDHSSSVYYGKGPDYIDHESTYIDFGSGDYRPR